MPDAAATTIPIAAERLRLAEAKVRLHRALLAGLDPASPAHPPMLARLKVSERAFFNRRLELDALQRERRRSLAAAAPPPSYSSGSAVNIRG